MKQAPYEIPVDKEGCAVNDRDEKWLKNEINFAYKLHKKIIDDVKEGDSSFLATLPDPWDFLDDGEKCKAEWKAYVKSSLDKLDEKYPGQKERYMDYITAMELFQHDPQNYTQPSKPKLNPEFKKELKIVRAFFDCREMKYMQMLCTLHDTIVNEFPHLLDQDAPQPHQFPMKSI